MENVIEHDWQKLKKNSEPIDNISTKYRYNEFCIAGVYVNFVYVIYAYDLFLLFSLSFTFPSN